MQLVLEIVYKCKVLVPKLKVTELLVARVTKITVHLYLKRTICSTKSINSLKAISKSNVSTSLLTSYIRFDNNGLINTTYRQVLVSVCKHSDMYQYKAECINILKPLKLYKITLLLWVMFNDLLIKRV